MPIQNLIVVGDKERQSRISSALDLGCEEFAAVARPASSDVRSIKDSIYAEMVDIASASLHATLSDFQVSSPGFPTREDLITYTAAGWRLLIASLAQGADTPKIRALASRLPGMAEIMHPGECPEFSRDPTFWLYLVTHEFVHLSAPLVYNRDAEPIRGGYEIFAPQLRQASPLGKGAPYFLVFNEAITDVIALKAMEKALPTLGFNPKRASKKIDELRERSYLKVGHHPGWKRFLGRVAEASKSSPQSVEALLIRGMYQPINLQDLSLDTVLGKGGWLLLASVPKYANLGDVLTGIMDNHTTERGQLFLEKNILGDNLSRIKRYRQVSHRFREKDFHILNLETLESLLEPIWAAKIGKLTARERALIADVLHFRYGSSHEGFTKLVVLPMKGQARLIVERDGPEHCHRQIIQTLTQHIRHLNNHAIAPINLQLEYLYEQVPASRDPGRVAPVNWVIASLLTDGGFQRGYTLNNLSFLAEFIRRITPTIACGNLNAADPRQIVQLALEDMSRGFVSSLSYPRGKIYISGEVSRVILDKFKACDEASVPVQAGTFYLRLPLLSPSEMPSIRAKGLLL